MKVYTIDGDDNFECFNFKLAKKKALEMALKTKVESVIICITKPGYKLSVYTMQPNGEITTEMRNYTAIN